MKRKISFKFAAPVIAAMLGCCAWGYYSFMKIELHAPGPIEGKKQPSSATAGMRRMLSPTNQKHPKAMSKGAAAKTAGPDKSHVGP